METVAVEFRKIYEHDIDLLILEEFLADPEFAQIFLEKAGLGKDCTVIKAAHSLSDSEGESDLTFVLQYPGKKIAILVEDKIDAQTMPEQSERYHRRAEKAQGRGEYDEHFVFLVAPEDYHKEHANDANADYGYRVSYEELRTYLRRRADVRAEFKAAMLDFAVQEKRTGYQVQEVETVTEFWKKLRQYCKRNFPELDMAGEDSPKGASAVWPEFRTSLKKVKVFYKSQRGTVDLEFPGYGMRKADLDAIVGKKLSDSMRTRVTGKSASVRIENERWRLDFTQRFEGNETVVDEVLQAVSELCCLADQFNYCDLY